MDVTVLLFKAKYSSEIIIYSPTPMVTDLGVLVLMIFFYALLILYVMRPHERGGESL